MAAITPAKPSFMDVTSKGKVRVWELPVIGANATGDTITAPGLKRVFSVKNAKTGVAAFTSSSDGHGNTVITLTVTAASTGDRFPLVVYGA